jgi:hypothetical protein
VVSYAHTRQLFQHGYAFRNAARGHEVWDTMQSLQEVLPQLVDAIDALRARVIPPAAL